ncbi:uncharacterized protein N7458_007072 [Penicillium daleae]|uniref:Uncharacterized protein n=1 Tax=Penicillium daleae TaxID=63821 RepID=A0AAD6C893_9EURO|nr:uncharacterized protein N7458_007072 [Penicillium daleae]KAJ5450623.1 hypothetical protein N7458_007072 [Penicillium daleae]
MSTLHLRPLQPRVHAADGLIVQGTDTRGSKQDTAVRQHQPLAKNVSVAGPSAIPKIRATSAQDNIPGQFC